MLLDIVLWILFGALAGWVASMIMKTDASMGALANIIVGIVGAFIGGFLVRTILGVPLDGGFNLASLLVAILGAVLLLAVFKAIGRARGNTN